MLRLLLSCALVALVWGGRSPGADFIDQLDGPGTRYSNNILEDARLDVPELVAKYGYPIEVHNVITKDGYNVTMHRIPHGRDSHNQHYPNKPIVIVMHGLMSSSADFVVLGPGNALAYLLAEEGYDVWLGNARGNYYSRRHIYLNPDRDTQFWRFSWDEIGNIDLPACLAHIERVTGQKRLHYIGHSQGGTTFFVLNSLRPEYNKKFISFQALAPGVYFRYNQHPAYHFLAANIDWIEPAVFALTKGEVLRNRQWFTWFGILYCHEGSPFAPVCDSLIFSGMSENFNKTMMPIFMGHAPAGASIRQFAHYSQGITYDTFRRFNHSPLKNLAIYGSTTPPDYDISLVTARTYVHYSIYDETAYWKDVELLPVRGKVPNISMYKIDAPDFGHVDFIWSNVAKSIVYDKMFALMKEAEQSSK